MYMEDGFIFIPRKFLDGSIWQEKKAYSQSAALIDLHVMARFAAEPAEVVVARRRVRVERWWRRCAIWPGGGGGASAV